MQIAQTETLPIDGKKKNLSSSSLGYKDALQLTRFFFLQTIARQTSHVSNSRLALF